MKYRFVFIFFCAGLCCIITGTPILSREKRHFAEFKTSDYATRIALEKHLRRCLLIGCGLVNIEASGKRKRESSSPGLFSDEEKQYLISKFLQKARK